MAGRVPSPAEFAAMRLSLKVGDTWERDALVEELVRRGYRAERLVEEVGTFAVRGGLVDLFPFGSRHPLRVELFDDRIESLRTFDAATQRTVDPLPSISLLPQRELMAGPKEIAAAAAKGPLPFEEGSNPFVDGIEAWLPRFSPGAGSLLAHFAANGVVVLDEPDRLREALADHHAEAQSAYDALPAATARPPAPAELFLSAADVAAALAGRTVLRLALFRRDSARTALRAADGPVAEHRVHVHSQETFRGGFSVLRERLQAQAQEGNEVWVFCDNRGQLGRLEEMLEGVAGTRPPRGGDLTGRLLLPARKLAVLTDHEIFARYGAAPLRSSHRRGGDARHP